MATPKSITGRTRQHKTSRLVRAGDVIARILITLGGIGTILAVSLVCVFLVFVVYPLFVPAAVSGEERVDMTWQGDQPWHFAVDEYQLLGWALFPDGTVRVFRLDTGRVIENTKLFPKQELTAFSPPGGEHDVMFAFKDGKLRLSYVRFLTETLVGDGIPNELRDLPVGTTTEHAGGVAQRLSSSQMRWQRLKIDFTEPVEGASEAPVRRIDHVKNGNDIICAILAADGKLHLNSIQQKKSLTTGKTTYELESTQQVPLMARLGKGLPNYVLLSALGRDVYTAWDDGVLHRYHATDTDPPKLEEEVPLTSDADATLTALQFLIARTTLVAGDSAGRVRGWFQTAPPGAPTSDRSPAVGP